MSANLALSFKIDAETAAAIRKVSAFQRELAALNGVKIQDPTAGITAGFSVAARGAAGLAAGFVALGAAAAGAAAAVGLAMKRGFDTNSEMESTALGIKAIIASLQDVRTASGAPAQGMEKLAIAGEEAQRQLQLLRVAGMNTSAEFKDLAAAFQTALGAGSGAGLGVDQIRELTVTLTQAAGAFNLAGDQLSSEIRAVLSGDQVDNSQIAQGLGITGAQIKLWREQGTLVENLNKRLETFKQIGDEAGKTWTATLSNVSDGISMFLGETTKGAFDSIKTALQDALGQAIDSSTGNIKPALQGIADFATTVFTGIGEVLAAGIQGGINLLADLSAWLDANKEEVDRIFGAFGNVWEVLKDIFGTVGDVVGGLLGAGAETKAWSTLVDAVAVAIAFVGDSVKTVIGLFGTMGSVIAGTVLSALYLVGKAIDKITLGSTNFAGFIEPLLDAAKGFGDEAARLAREGANFEMTKRAIQRAENNQNFKNDPANYSNEGRNRGGSTGGTVLPPPKKDGKGTGSGKAGADAAKAAKQAAEQYAKALKAYSDAELEVAKKAAAAQREVAQVELEEALNNRLITQAQYLDKKADLERQAVDEERQALNDRIDLLQKERDAETDPAKQKKLEADLLKLKGELDNLASKEVVIDTKLRIDKENFKREVESLRVDITANILDLEGNPFESTLQRLKKETQDLLNDPRVRGNPDMESAVRRQAQLREDRAQFDEQKRLSEERLDFMRLAEDEIAFKVEQGKMTALEAERAVREERLKGAAAILEQVKALEALAAANPKNNELALAAQKARLEYEKLNGTLDATATSINRDIAGSFSGAIDALSRGESAIRSLGGALSDVFGNLAKRALKQFEDSLFNALEGKSGQGAGSLLSQFIGGKGFDLSKLFSGIGGIFGGLGLPFFYGLRSQIRGGRRMPGYAEGGLVGGGMAGVAERSFNPTIQNNLQLSPNLYLDPADLANQLGRQPQFGRDVAKVIFVDNESKLRR
jgi:hypothetical protein